MTSPALSLGVPLLTGGTVVSAVLLAGAFALLLIGAEIFTNGVEWLGQRLGLGDSATGSILAAVGTALPETMIPVIAIVGAFLSQGGDDASGVAIGAILGAPFLLATIAMFLIGVSVWYFRDRREHGTHFQFNASSTQRDLSFFLAGYSLAVIAAFIQSELVTTGIAVLLVVLYCVYVYRSIKADEFVDEGEELDDLYLGKIAERFTGGGSTETVPDGGQGYASDPPRWIVVLQTLIALAIIIGGAHLFVTEVQYFSTNVFNLPPAIFSLLLAPLATELPEKFNSIIWIADDKDTLAIGNITGAMAFQGTLPVTLGILFLPWNLTLEWGTVGFVLSVSALLAIVSAIILVLRSRAAEDTMHPAPFLIGGVFYLVFIVVTVYHVLAFQLAVSGH